MGLRKVIYVIVIFLLVISIVSVPGFVGEEENKKCTWENCKELIWEGSDEYCIFHDPDPNKDRDLFLDELQKRMDRGDYDFSGFVFPRNITTVFSSPHHSYHFDKKVYFKNAVFWSYTSFTDITFEEGADFSGAIFKAGTDFVNVTFNGITDFNDVTFEGKVLFLDTTFKKEAWFKKGGLDEGTTFKGETSFSGVNFEESVYFDEAVFEKRVSFYSSGGIGEEQTIFGKEEYPNERKRTTSFIKTEFHGQTTFNDCVFNVEANFQSAEFKGDTEFYGVVFEKESDFKRAKFEQIFTFVPTKNGEIDLRYFRCFGDGKIIANLDKTHFLGIYSVENLNLDGSTWPENYIIYEERCIDLHYESLEAIYRSLKKSFKANGNEDYAGKFYYREMEMKKLGAEKEGKFFEKWFFWGFKWSCGYAEKPLYLVGLSFIVMFGFAGFFYFGDLKIKDYIRCFKYRKILGETFRSSLSMRDSFNYFIHSFFFSVCSFTTLGSSYIKPKGKWTYRFSAIESFIGALLIATFVYLILRKLLRYF